MTKRRDRITDDERIEDWCREIGRAPDATLARIIARLRRSMRNANYRNDDQPHQSNTTEENR